MAPESTKQIARRPGQVTCKVGHVTNEQKSVRGQVPFFSRASVINRQYTIHTLSVSVNTAKHNRSLHGSYRVTLNSLYTLTMLIEVFQVDTDKPIKYDVTSYRIQ